MKIPVSLHGSPSVVSVVHEGPGSYVASETLAAGFCSNATNKHQHFNFSLAFCFNEMIFHKKEHRNFTTHFVFHFISFYLLLILVRKPMTLRKANSISKLAKNPMKRRQRRKFQFYM